MTLHLLDFLRKITIKKDLQGWPSGLELYAEKQNVRILAINRTRIVDSSVTRNELISFWWSRWHLQRALSNYFLRAQINLFSSRVKRTYFASQCSVISSKVNELHDKLLRLIPWDLEAGDIFLPVMERIPYLLPQS